VQKHSHAGLFGLVVGIVGGIIAAILLAPKRRDDSVPASSRVLETTISTGLDLLEAAVDGVERMRERIAATTEASGMLPDERLTSRIRNEIESRGIWTSRVDITTVDGVVYLRGREADNSRVETIVGIVEAVPGVVSVVDEIRRD
jgi:osmotically-inducible protein OsmY